MPFRFLLSLLLTLQLVLVPLAQSGPALAATGQFASLAAGGDAEDTALAGRLSRSIDKNNRQLHKTEAEKLEALLNEAETEEEKQRLRAAACYLVKCSNGVADGSGLMDEEDSAHNELAALQEKGAGYTEEIAALKGTGEFEHTTEDSLEDALRRNRRLTETTRGGVEIGIGTAAMVSGAKLTVVSAGACGFTLGLSCLAIPLGGLTIAGGTVDVHEGGQRLRSVFNGSDAYTDEGQRVLDSFSPSTHRGDENLVRDVGVETAKNIVTAAAGGAALKYGGKLVLDKLGNAKDYVVGGFTKLFKTSDVSAPKGRKLGSEGGDGAGKMDAINKVPSNGRHATNREADVDPSTPVGRRTGFDDSGPDGPQPNGAGQSNPQLEVPSPTNTPAVINGRSYSGHALDRMQGRGLTPSVMDNTIKQRNAVSSVDGVTTYVDPVNNVTAIVNDVTGNVITAY